MISVAAEPSLATPALWLTGLERAVMLAGLAISLGGLAGRGLARQYKGERPGPLPTPWTLRGSLLGLAASLALLVTAVIGPGIAAQLSQPPPEGLHNGGTAEIAAIEAVLFALAAIMARIRRGGLATLFLTGVVLAEGVRSHPEGVVPAAGAFVTYCHLYPAILWAGMLLYAVRAAIAWRHTPDAAQGIIRLYATAAAWLFAVVLITGVVSALVLVPLHSLLTTTYGRFLIAKAVIVCIAAGLAMAGRRWLRRTAAPGVGPATATRLEICALAAILLITGILTVLTPPAKASHNAAPTPDSHVAQAWSGAPALVAARHDASCYDGNVAASGISSLVPGPAI